MKERTTSVRGGLDDCDDCDDRDDRDGAVGVVGDRMT
jgi:hypothetical protein